MVTMTVLIIVTKIIDINVMTENAILRQNLLVKKISNGEDLSVFQRNGFVMEILTVLMVLMKIQQFTAAQHHNRVLMTNLHAAMEDVLIMDGFVIMIMIVEMDLMRENSVILNTRLAQLKNLHVKTSNVLEINIDVVR